MKTQFTEDGIGSEIGIGDILEANNSSREMREFSNGRLDEDKDEETESEFNGDTGEGLNYAPEDFAGLHPNHRGYGRARLAYRQDNRALSMFASN